MKDGWQRYKSRDVCKICGHGGSTRHHSGCAYVGPVDNPFAILCLRIEKGSVKAAKDGMGYVHKMRNDPNRPPPDRAKRKEELVIDLSLSPRSTEFERAIMPETLAAMASVLGVTADSLKRLAMGWCQESQAFSFPMRSPGNAIVGIRLRNVAGQKWAVKGSLNGLFIPRGLPCSGTMYVVEGPTETAAMLTLGLSAIGRPSNTAGREWIVAYAKRFLPRRPIIIVRNNDPKGSHAEALTLMGATELARQLETEAACASVDIVAPPETKDVRDWVKLGCTVHDFTEQCQYQQ